VLYLNKENFFCIKNEFGKASRKVSKFELEWTFVLDSLYPEKKLETEFNNENGQHYFNEAIPDAYSQITKQAFFLMNVKFMVMKNVIYTQIAILKQKHHFVKHLEKQISIFLNKWKIY
jgi:hypothetical protein